MDPEGLLRELVKPATADVLDRARDFSRRKLALAREAIDAVLAGARVDPTDVIVVAVGSMGRFEALDASDVDLVPVGRNVVVPAEVDARLRRAVADATGLEVSQGKDLTKACTLASLTDVESIGGTGDSSEALTRRILLLTESASAGGALPISELRRAILTAYSAQETTRGRHVLSLANDVARYYRTLCIEYKAKIDAHAKDWGTRNLKLRHSRKLWLASCAVGMSAIASPNTDRAQEALLQVLEQPPILRLLGAVRGNAGAHGPAARAIEAYAWFLEYMSSEHNRGLLEKVTHSTRYQASAENPFPALKYNSDVLHLHLRSLVDSLDGAHRGRLLDWFLF